MEEDKKREYYRIAKEKAKAMGRQFVDWDNLSDKEKQALLNDKVKQEKSFIFADTKLVDQTKLKGLPKLSKETILNKREQHLKERLFESITTSTASNGEVVNVLGYLIQKFKNVKRQ